MKILFVISLALSIMPVQVFAEEWNVTSPIVKEGEKHMGFLMTLITSCDFKGYEVSQLCLSFFDDFNKHMRQLFIETDNTTTGIIHSGIHLPAYPN
jgi:hypothetical protein